MDIFHSFLPKLKTIMGWLLATYLLLFVGFYALQKQVFFQPKSLATGFVFDIDVPYEEHYLIAKDGTKINSIYIKTPHKKRGAILYLHGNADNLQRWANYHHNFTDRAYDFFAIDYRGFGKTEGDIEEEKYYSDALLAYNFLRKTFAAHEIVLYGRSMGTGVASTLATQVNAQKLCLETPYNNLRDVVRKKAPFLWLPFNLRYQFQNDENIPRANCPVFIFHGTKDRVVPYKCGVKLRTLLPNPQHFYTIKGGGHKNLTKFPAFQRALDEVLGELK